MRRGSAGGSEANVNRAAGTSDETDAAAQLHSRMSVLTGMSGRDWSLPCGRICVLDIEAAPDRHAQILAGRQRAAPRGSPLNEIVTASLLTFEENELNQFGRFDLRSFHHGRHTERDVLLNVQAELDRVASDGLLVSFNGSAFDLPMLWLRQIRWWLCDSDAVPRINAEMHRHVDVMLELSLGGAGRWPSLDDACASFGFSLQGTTPIGQPDATPCEVRKCERDVAATAMLFLHVLAAGRRSSDPLLSGLPALGAFLHKQAHGKHHLERFALNAMFADNPRPWGDRK